MVNGKQMLVIDFDDTIVDSERRLREMYGKEFGVPVPVELMTWDGKDVFHLADNSWAERQFSKPEFFDDLYYIPDAPQALDRIRKSGKFYMVLCSMGSPENIKNKADFIKSEGLYNFFDDIVLNVKYDGCTPAKSFLDSNAIVVDDHYNNLQRCKHPVLFQSRSIKNWNKDRLTELFCTAGRTGFCARSWEEVEMAINGIYNREKLYAELGCGVPIWIPTPPTKPQILFVYTNKSESHRIANSIISQKRQRDREKDGWTPFDLIPFCIDGSQGKLENFCGKNKIDALFIHEELAYSTHFMHRHSCRPPIIVYDRKFVGTGLKEYTQTLFKEMCLKAKQGFIKLCDYDRSVY